MPEKDGADDKKTTKSVVNKKQKQMMGEEGYDRYRDRILMRGGDHRSDETKNRSYTPTGKQPKGKTVLQKQTEKKYGKGKSALDIVKADITAKYGKGAIMNVKKEELDLTQVAESFGGHIVEYVGAITKAAAKEAAKGAITTTAKQVGKETLKQGAKQVGKETVKQAGGQIVKQGGGAIVKQGGGAIVKQGGGQLVKKGGGAIVKQGGGQLAKQGGGAIVKSGGNKIVKTGRTFKGFQDKVKTVDAVPVGGEVKKSSQLAKNVKPKSGPTVDVRPLGGEITKRPQGQITKPQQTEKDKPSGGVQLHLGKGGKSSFVMAG